MRGRRMKKKKEAGYRVPLFDRLFPPQRVTLKNGHTVDRPRSRTPLIVALILGLVWLSVKLTGFDLGIIARRGNQFLVILRQIFSPDVFNISQGTYSKFGLEPGSVTVLSVFDGRWWQALFPGMAIMPRLQRSGSSSPGWSFRGKRSGMRWQSMTNSRKQRQKCTAVRWKTFIFMKSERWTPWPMWSQPAICCMN